MLLIQTLKQEVACGMGMGNPSERITLNGSCQGQNVKITKGRFFFFSKRTRMVNPWQTTSGHHWALITLILGEMAPFVDASKACTCADCINYKIRLHFSKKKQIMVLTWHLFYYFLKVSSLFCYIVSVRNYRILSV